MPFLKTLSPSGVELEIMKLGNFDFNNAELNPSQQVRKPDDSNCVFV